MAKKSDSQKDKNKMDIEKFDLLVIGCGPAGQKAAIAASKLGKNVAIVEPLFLGGNCTHFGTLPSKTFREAAIHLTDHRLRFLGPTKKVKPTMESLVHRVDWVISNEVKVIESQLRSNNVTIIPGFGKYKSKNTLDVLDEKKKIIRTVKFVKTVICTGSTPFLDPNIPFDNKKIFSSDSVLQLKKIPRSITIIGGGIIGCEYASIFSVLGVKVNLVEKRGEILALIDREMRANLVHQLDTRKTIFFLDEELDTMKISSSKRSVETCLKSGKCIRSEVALICTFRTVNSEKINLDALGLKPGSRGVIDVNDRCQTKVPHVFAAGDVVGSPALASTSFEQGRIAGTSAFCDDCSPLSPNLPIGIYTIPEISFVGPTESELTAQNIPFSVGKSFFKDTSRGAIMGALDGVLKLVFHQKTHQLLSVHVIGENATEIVHVGQVVIEFGGKIEYFIDNVFNFPTLAETYKYAALNGLNRLNDI